MDMASDVPDGPTDTDPVDDRRYRDLTVADEQVVIYDRENARAWIQSTVAVPGDAHR